MSHTIAHRPHAHPHHIPLAPVLAVIVAIAVAALVIWALNQPATVTVTTTGAEVAVSPVVHPATVAAPESPVFRHAQMRVAAAGGHPRAYVVGRAHMIEGTTLEPVSTSPYGTGPYRAPHYPR